VISEVVPEAIGLFAVTNVDDLVLLTVFFGRAPSARGTRRVVTGQYLGFGAIVLVSLAAAIGARQLPKETIALLGLLPLALGVRAAWSVWRNRHDPDRDPSTATTPLGPLAIAGVTFANGADNIGVYVPVFAVSRAGDTVAYVAIFLVLVAVWCGAGLWLARRPPIARALSRWGHLVLPVVLIGIGVVILVEGGALGL